MTRVTVAAAAEVLQFTYPQVYYACHSRHSRARSGQTHLSDRDVQLLVHLDRREPMRVTGLARHMGLSASTVSEAVASLERLGYVTKARDAAGDRRAVSVLLTLKGIAAVRAGSVLETPRLQAVLRRLDARERTAVAHAMKTLAAACRPAAVRRK